MLEVYQKCAPSRKQVSRSFIQRIGILQDVFSDSNILKLEILI